MRKRNWNRGIDEVKKRQNHWLLTLTLCLLMILSNAKQTLAQGVKYDEEAPGVAYPFIWSSPGSPYLTELRNKYSLEGKVAGCENDYEKARAIVAWVNCLWEHHGINTPRRSDPLSILEEVEEGKRFRCVEYAIVVAGALNALGIPARTVGLKTKYVESELFGAGHVVAEAYLNDLGKWIMIDGQWGVIPTLDGTPLNAVELQQALASQTAGLDVYNDSGVDKEEYFNWIKDYLYYIDVPFDNRTGIDPEEYAGGILMLVPEKAIRPEKFQIKWRIKNAVYTHAVRDLYPRLTPEIYEDVAEKKAEIQKLFQSKSVDAQTGLYIEEIVIAGLDRTKEGIVKEQLPFKVGDKWTREQQELAEQRLGQLAVFNPLNVRVRAERIGGESVRVLVSTEDVHPFMVHPVKISLIGEVTKAVIFKGIDLLDQKFSHRIINPWGNGLSISAGVHWGTDPWWKIGLDYAGTQGKVYSWDYMNFICNDESFNQTHYHMEGFKTRFALAYLPAAGWKWTIALNYQENNFQVDQENKGQTYLSVETEIKRKKEEDIDLRFTYGKSLRKEEPDFQQGEISWTKATGFNNNKLISRVCTGISSQETPLNYQFKGGGKGGIPLRGHEYNLAGNRYLSGYTEFHKLIVGNAFIGLFDLWGMAFIDYAKIIPAHRSYSDLPWEIDGGVGVVCDTPFGLLKAEVGLDNFKEKPIYYLTFEKNF